MREEYIAKMKSIFDFEVDETLSLEKIIRATFSNPDRNKFVEKDSSIDFSKSSHHQDSLESEALINLINSQMPDIVE